MNRYFRCYQWEWGVASFQKKWSAGWKKLALEIVSPHPYEGKHYWWCSIMLNGKSTRKLKLITVNSHNYNCTITIRINVCRINLPCFSNWRGEYLIEEKEIRCSEFTIQLVNGGHNLSEQISGGLNGASPWYSFSKRSSPVVLGQNLSDLYTNSRNHCYRRGIRNCRNVYLKNSTEQR